MPAARKSSRSSSSLTESTSTPAPIESAEAAGLRYVSDETPGISRKRAGKGFTYLNAQGETIKDENVLRRIKALAIPPAYKDVWICPYENGHLQAVGLDERGRKQYRYHEKWRQVRDENKYGKMIAFGQALPKIRRRTAKDLKQRGLPRTKVLAAIVQLLEKTMIRVGSEEYVQQNKSYGLTTMRNRHAEVRGSRVTFDFKGKSGVRHNIDLKDEELARIVAKLQDLPGQELFQYVDEEGEIQSATSSDVNAYLKEITGEDFSAKDFRTWSGTVLAAMALQEFEKFDSQTQAKKNLVQAIENVAERLGNTPSVCRKCYVHPAVMEAYLDGSMLEALQQQTEAELKKSLRGLRAAEAAVLAFLQRRLQSEVGDNSTRKSRSRKKINRKEKAMPRGDKSSYTDKQKRQAEHIEEGYEERGVPKDEAESRAWATVNKSSGGGKKSGSGRGKPENKAPAKKGGAKGGAASAARPAAERSASAKKAAATRKKNASQSS